MKKIFFLLLIITITASVYAQEHKTKNIIIVTLDGFRWQELYRGADSALINSQYTQDKDEVRKKYWSASLTARRKMLMPFMWSVIDEQGQLYGNRGLGNKDEVANHYHFSYPGYNEIFTGFPDERMNTNDPVTNPNMNVLEFLNKQQGYEHKVAVFSSWERFPQILNAERSGIAHKFRIYGFYGT